MPARLCTDGPDSEAVALCGRVGGGREKMRPYDSEPKSKKEAHWSERDINGEKQII